MQNGYDENINQEEPTIIKSSSNAKNGQDKCPKCGATDISLNSKTGKLRCNFCRTEFDPEKVEGMVTDLNSLTGEVIGSGATNINSDAEDIITLKCSSCGAEVVIDTTSATQARCHWCRNTLSINEQIPNGSIPDMVLPFGISKEVAKTEIEKFVGKRKFFANPKFRQEFTTENIMGVYLPYMLVDINAHAHLVGQGEHETRRYTVQNGNSTSTRYEADLYHVERDFDIVINGLSIESSEDKLDNHSSNKTNNVINAIMPFDLENCVQFNANYLKGYTSEKRDTNIDTLKPLVELQAKNITRFSANKTLEYYDRGVAWSNEELEVRGHQWMSAYLPVWLYSYMEVKKDKKIVHYVAVNARTKETMGSVPINIPRLLGISAIIEILGIILMMLVNFEYNWLFLTLGVIYFIYMYFRYRNSQARHKYETETKTNITNLKKVDNFIQKESNLSSGTIRGANNTTLRSK